MLGISRFSISKQIQYWFYLPIILRNGDGRSLLSWLVQIPFEPSLPSSKQPTKTTGKPMESGVDHFPKDPWIFFRFREAQHGPTTHACAVGQTEEGLMHNEAASLALQEVTLRKLRRFEMGQCMKQHHQPIYICVCAHVWIKL
jgi:hypothetical protein